MTGRLTVGLIGLGEVGQVLATDLDRKSELELSAWDRLFAREDSEPCRAALARPYLRRAQGMSEAVHDRALVISAVTADECLAAAAEAARALTPGTYYLDLNSVAPQTKVQSAQAVEAAGGRYIEAAVMSPIASSRTVSTRSSPC